MAFADKFFSANVAGTVGSPENAIGNTPTTWTTDANTNVSWTHRWKLEEVVGSYSPSGQQTLKLRVRKGSNSGNPTISSVAIYHFNSLVATISTGAVTVTSTTGQDVTYQFDGSILPALTNLSVEISVTAVGGSGSVRNTVAIAMATWTAQYVDQAVQQNESGGSISAVSIATSGGGIALEHVVAGGLSIVSIASTGGGTMASDATPATVYNEPCLYMAIYPSDDPAPTWSKVTGWSGTPVYFSVNNAPGASGQHVFVPDSSGLQPGTPYIWYAVYHDGADTVVGPVASDLWFTLNGAIVRAIILSNGALAVLPLGQEGSGKKPIVLLDGAMKERAADEGVPLILDAGALRTIATGETLVI